MISLRPSRERGHANHGWLDGVQHSEFTPIFHKFWGIPPDQAMEQQINFMKNVSIVGGFLLLFAFGPGRYSLDQA